MRVLAISMAGLLIAGCSSGPKVMTGQAPSAAFAAYHTYTWAAPSVPAGMNPLLYDHVKTSVDRALAAKSFTRSSDDPDFAVALTLGPRDRVQTADFGVYGASYPGYRGPGGSTWDWSTIYTPIDIGMVTDGSISVDIYDADTRQPVWHAHAPEEVPPGEIDQREIDKMVDKLLDKFPPSGKD